MLAGAQSPLPQLDETCHELSHFGYVDRPYQKEIRTRGRKRTPPPATHHPPQTGEMTCLYQNGPDALGASGQDGSKLEANVVHRSAGDVTTVASTETQAVLEVQV